MIVQKLKHLYFTLFIGILFVVLVNPSFAHVVVKPDQVGVGAFQTFTVGVPNEKDIPTVAIRLLIPKGLNHVSPNVKPGWTIETKSTGEGEDSQITEILWTGGSIPAGQRDEYLYSAQVPSTETKLVWKAYQTYEDGSVIAWDMESSNHEHEEEDSNKGPASTTKIVNDLNSKEITTDREEQLSVLPIVSIIISLTALIVVLRNRK